MTGFTKEQQDAYFHDGKCPYCGSQEIRMTTWEEHDDLVTRHREVFCDDCEASWKEVHCRDAGRSFLLEEGEDFDHASDDNSTILGKVLSEAIGEIEECERDFPASCGDLAQEISVVKTLMDCLRLYADTFPAGSKECGKLAEDLCTAIRTMPLTELIAARDRLVEFVRNANEG